MIDASKMADTMSLSSMGDDSNPTAHNIEKTFLTCPICFEVYDRPKCLPCLHTFCYGCLLSYIESKDMYGIRGQMGFPCPICKQIVSIRKYYNPYKAWLDEIQNNFLIQNMIDCLVSTERHDGTPHTGSDSDTDVDEAAGVAVPLIPSSPHQQDTDRVTPQPPVPTPNHVPTPMISPDLNLPASDLLRMHTSQFGLNQRWASPPVMGHLSQWRRGEATSPGCVSGTIGQTISASSSSASATIRVPLNPPISYSATSGMKKTYVMSAKNWADYRPPQLSDVICLPKRNGIIVLDWDNRCVKYVKNVFLGRNVTTAFEVIGRPCSVTLLDKEAEHRIAVSVLNRNKLYFIRVPDLNMIDVMDTRRPYRGLTALSPTAILAGSPGSPGKPACVDLIKLDHRCKMVTCQTIYKNEAMVWSPKWDLHFPNYITAVSSTSFIVSDARKNSLVYFDIEGDNHSTKVVKKFTLNPPDYRQFREIGGVYHHHGCVYVVDTTNSEVHKVILHGETVECVNILKPRDDLMNPASVCVGPRGEVCVADWHGNVTIYTSR